MSYDTISPKEIMLYCRKYLMEAHELMECMSSGWHILQNVVFNWRICFT